MNKSEGYKRHPSVPKIALDKIINPNKDLEILSKDSKSKQSSMHSSKPKKIKEH
jgi:hypothetical protein